jgi:hypothetical protein
VTYGTTTGVNDRVAHLAAARCIAPSILDGILLVLCVKGTVSVARRDLFLLFALLSLAVLITVWPAPAMSVASPTPGGHFIYLPAALRNFRLVPVTVVSDDFSDAGSGWPEVDETDYSIAYVDGEYRIFVKSPNQAGGAKHPHFRCADCVLEVDARYAADSYGAYGLSFGVTEDDESFYLFVIWEEGYYEIWKVIGGVAPDDPLYTAASPHINRGQSTNQLRVVREGQDIRLYINGENVITLPDDDIMGSLGVGLLAGSGEISGVDVRFDNFFASTIPSNSKNAFTHD